MEMDPVSISASIAGILTFAGHLSGAVNSVMNHSRTARKELKNVDDDIQSASSILQMIRVIVDQASSAAPPTVRSRLLWAPDGDTMLSGSHEVLRDIERLVLKIRKDQTKNWFKRRIATVTWPTRKKELQELRGELQHRTDRLKMILDVWQT